MQCVKDRNILNQGAACISGPIERVYVYEVKFGGAPLQLEKKVKEQIRLRKETGISRAFLYGLRKAGRLNIIRHGNRLNLDAGDERFVAAKKFTLGPGRINPC